MMKPLLKILIGILVLIVFIDIGIPFEIENPIIESILRTLSFAIIFFLLYMLFQQTKKFNNSGFRIVTYTILGLLSFLFLLGALWNDIWVFEKNERNTWYNLEVCTNQSGKKILRQMRETSGSIYDYRNRLVVYEFDKNNRISINTNVKNYSGPWTVVVVKNNKKQRMQRLE